MFYINSLFITQSLIEVTVLKAMLFKNFDKFFLCLHFSTLKLLLFSCRKSLRFLAHKFWNCAFFPRNVREKRKTQTKNYHCMYRYFLFKWNKKQHHKYNIWWQKKQCCSKTFLKEINTIYFQKHLICTLNILCVVYYVLLCCGFCCWTGK